MLSEDEYVLDGEMLTMKIQKTGLRTVNSPDLHSGGRQYGGMQSWGCTCQTTVNQNCHAHNNGG
jgi:hypothetical protein